MPKVYLAGPIADLSYRDAMDWRGDVQQALEMWGIEAICPMRGHEHLTTQQRLSATLEGSDHIIPTCTRKGIMSRDFFDVTTADMIFVNLLGAQRISIGTMMEVAWAFQKRTPIVCVMEEDKTNIHEHGMLNEAIDFRVSTLSAGIDVVRSVLNVKHPLELTYTKASGQVLVKKFDPHETVIGVYS